MIAFLLCSLSVVASGQSAGASPQPDPQLIRVHVQTDAGGVAEELAGRRASVAHLVTAIAGQKKGKVIAVVADEDTADVIVEVRDRGVIVPKVVIGLGAMGSQPGRRAPVAPSRTVELRVTLRMARADEAFELANKNRPVDAEPGWKQAADDIAKQVEQWIADHRAAILQARR